MLVVVPSAPHVETLQEHSPRSAQFLCDTESPETEISALFCLKLYRNNQKASAQPKLAASVPSQYGVRTPEVTQGRHGHHQDLPASFPEEKKQTRTANTEVTRPSSFWDTPSPQHHGGANKSNPPLNLLGEVLGGFCDKHRLCCPKTQPRMKYLSLLCSVFCLGFGGGKD